jgi:hypothetical protein
MHRAPLVVPAAALLLGIVAEAHGFTAAFAFLCAAVALFRRDAVAGGLFGLLIGHLHGHPATVEREFPTAAYAGTVVGDVRSQDGLITFPFEIAGFGTLDAFRFVPASESW